MRSLSRVECIRPRSTARYTNRVQFKKVLSRTTIVTLVLATSAMWIYAFIFSPREAVNRISDEEWQARAQEVCTNANLKRAALADFRLIAVSGPEALLQRADIVDKATAILASMIDSIESTPPTDAKGRALVPQWIADYRIYIEDRLAYTAILRQGKNLPFSETMVEGLPLSEKISKFAADNEMSACKAPMDLSV